MSLFHTHQWEVTGSDFTPPSEYPFGDCEGTGGTLDKILGEIRRARTGETHIYLKCATCGDIESKVVLGKWLGGKP